MSVERDPLARLAAVDPARESPPAEEERRAADALLASLIAGEAACASDEAGRRGGRRIRRGLRRDPGRLATAGLAVVVAVCALVLADPFGGDGDGGVLERALAAFGDGRVVHLVTETDTGAELVDLESGRRRALPLESETWFDPRRGLRVTLRVGGTVVEAYGVPRGRRLSMVPASLGILTRNYRDALDNGSARVVREDEIDGHPVYWLRIPVGVPASRCATPASRSVCRDVAISRETYEPLYLDVSSASERQRTLERIVLIETLPEAAVAVPGRDREAGAGIDMLPRRAVDRSGANRLLDGGLVWPGRHVGGLRLARMNAAGFRRFRFDGQMRRPWYGPTEPVVRLMYASPHDVAAGRDPSTWEPVLAIQQARRLPLAVAQGPALDVVNRLGARPAPYNYVPPGGKAVIAARGHQAILRHRGVLIMVLGSSPGLVLDGVEALTGARPR